MPRILPTLGLALALRYATFAQAPPPTLTLTLQDAMERAKANSQQLLSADIASRIAHEDRVQAKAALLPQVTWLNGFSYTQPNGPNNSIIFVTYDGPRVYTNMANVHSDVLSPGKRADYQVSIAAEAIARAKAEIAARGLIATVYQNFYGMAVAQRHLKNAQLSLQDAQQFADITRKQEAGGEVAHADVVKAEITLAQRERDLQEAQLAADKARIGFAVYLFPDFRQDFGVTDDLDKQTSLPPFPEIETLARNNNPDLRVAQATITQQTFGVRSARAGLLPVLSVDYFYGIQARQYALHDAFGQNNLGSAVVATLNVPVWNWGAARSKVKQAELRLQQARTDLSLSQRQLLSNLNQFYLEAGVASRQLASLRHSLDLSDESLRLTVLRYQAGEATVLEVVDAQTTLATARNAYDDGLARYRVALANVQTLTGAF
ncbi:MAG: outer rane efflux protein [Candidatus Solibacter sp.]|nr:outer rane efflux protein [Candidatus Solibacter sp.]